jgi:hypothetical protein
VHHACYASTVRNTACGNSVRKQLAPYELLTSFHVKYADWAFPIDWLALSGIHALVLFVLVIDLWSTCNRCIGEDRLEFGRKKGILVAEMRGSLEDDDKGVFDVLAFLASDTLRSVSLD